MNNSRTSTDIFFFPLFILVTFFCAFIYWPSDQLEFLTWDDNVHITENPQVTEGHWQSIWSEPHYGMFIPITSSLWAALWTTGEGSSQIFRFANLSFHLFNGFLVFLLAQGLIHRLQRVSGRFRLQSDFVDSWTSVPAVFGMAVFLLHPLQVGAVGWISGLRDVLSTSFGLLATLTFFRGLGAFSHTKDHELEVANSSTRLAPGLKNPTKGSAAKYSPTSRWLLLLSFGLFGFGLLTKPSLAILPFVLICYLMLFERSLLRSARLALIPWFLMGLLFAAWTSRLQAHVLSWEVPWWWRPLIALDSFGFHYVKSLVPFGLAADYGRTPLEVMALRMDSPLYILIGGLALIGAIEAYRMKTVTVFGALWFVALLPVSGIVDFGFQSISTVADHYNYLPLGLAGLTVSVGLAEMKRRWPKFLRMTEGFVLVVLIGFAWTSWVRIPVWNNSVAFFQDMLEQNQSSFSALVNLGGKGCSSNSLKERELGLAQIQRAFELRPMHPTAVGNLAYCLNTLRRFDESFALTRVLQDNTYQRQLQQDPMALGKTLASFAASAFYTDRGEISQYLACQSYWLLPYDVAVQKNLIGIWGAGSETASALASRACPPLDPIEVIAGKLR